MGATAREVADRYIGAARRDPEHAPIIFRRAAAMFVRLASDPQNDRVAPGLRNLAFDFAAAATRPQQATQEDLTRLLAETAMAFNEVDSGTEPPDQNDVIARRREIDAEVRGVPAVSISPLSFTNMDATLGRTTTVQYLDGLSNADRQTALSRGIRQSETVAFWQGAKAEARALGVDVNVQVPPPTPNPTATPSVSMRPYGIVEYGSDGNRCSATFDVGLGRRFTVVGNYVSVIVGMDPPLAGSPGVSMAMGASIGSFAAPSLAPLVRTIYVDQLASGQTTGLIAIPMRATQLLTVHTSLPLAGTGQIQFYGYGGGPTSQYSFFYQQSALFLITPIPVGGDAFFITVTNNAAGPQNFEIPFQLSL